MKRQWVIVLTALAALAAARPALAQNGQGDIMRALDEPLAALDISDTPVTDALKAVSDKTGMPIELDDDVLGCLPHGDQTRLSVKARNVKLRVALDAMLKPVDLRWRVGPRGVVVSPSHALLRLTRRPTFTEVKILAALNSVEITPGTPMIDQLRRATGIKELRLVWHSKPDEPTKAAALARGAEDLPCVGAKYLGRLCHGRAWTWFVWGTDLIITTEEHQAARQLKRHVTVQYKDQPLLAVLKDLAGKADLTLTFDPGVLTLVQEDTRTSFTLLMAEATIEEAFGAISGVTGLEFKTEGLGLRVAASDALAGTTTRPSDRPRTPFVVMLPVKGDDREVYRIFIRPDDLPPKLVERILARKAEFIEEMKAKYGAEVELPKTDAGTTRAETP